MPVDEGRTLRTLAAAIEDTLHAAVSMAGRAGDLHEGQDAAAAFWELGDAIKALEDHPALLRIKSLSHREGA